MKKILYILTALVLAGACGDGKSEGTPLLQGEVTLNGLSADKWTYFSLETGSVVGQSTFADEQEDASWAARTDWDLAICGDRLKTNGGTSGKGLGGILRDTQESFLSLEEAPADGYLNDQTFKIL